MFMIFSLIFLTLLVGIFVIFLVDAKNLSVLRPFSLVISAIVWLLSCWMLVEFKHSCFYFQQITTYSIGSSFLNLTYSFGLDGISLFFFVLSSLLILICILFIWNDKFFKEYALNLLTIELFLLIVFSILDLFLFYVFFEAILIPMYLIIGVWGSRERKIRAVYLFFFLYPLWFYYDVDWYSIYL